MTNVLGKATSKTKVLSSEQHPKTPNVLMRQKINISEKVLPQQSKLEKNGLLLQ